MRIGQLLCVRIGGCAWHIHFPLHIFGTKWICPPLLNGLREMRVSKVSKVLPAISMPFKRGCGTNWVADIYWTERD